MIVFIDFSRSIHRLEFLSCLELRIEVSDKARNFNMKNVIVLVEPPKEANDISTKAGNLYINRLCIDEDAAFELSGVHYFETSDILKSSANKSKGSKRKDNFRNKREFKIDFALRKAAETDSDDLELHLINVGDYFSSWTLEGLLRKGIQKYEFESVLVSTIYMYRDLLISKENMERICMGKAYRKDEHRHQYWYGDRFGKNRYEESVNDDLELYFNDLQLGREPTSWNWTYFLPELTPTELKLVEEKNKDYFQTFVWSMNPDVDEDEMKSSTSNSKYVSGYCRRRTFKIENPKLQEMDNSNKCCALQ